MAHHGSCERARHGTISIRLRSILFRRGVRSAIEQARTLTDNVAEALPATQIEAMHRAFRRSTQFKGRFWDATSGLEA
jgi:hypothetical protein